MKTWFYLIVYFATKIAWYIIWEDIFGWWGSHGEYEVV